MRYMEPNQYKKLLVVLAWLLSICALPSCKKYLDQKPVDTRAVPSSLADLQAVLDDQRVNSLVPRYMEISADDYFVTDAVYGSLSTEIQKLHVWAPDARITVSTADWSNPYQAIYEANFVLNLLPTISFQEGERSNYNSIKGSAYFQRAIMLNQLAQLFSKPY